MRRSSVGLLAGLVALAGCAETAAVADPAAMRAGQEAACAAVVAPHVGMAVEQVTPAWDHATPEGTAIVTVRHGGSLHTCEVDGQMRVHELQHPGY